MAYFKDIVYGTQYYRAPTPMPDEWETDIIKMEVDSKIKDSIKIKRIDVIKLIYELSKKVG